MSELTLEQVIIVIVYVGLAWVLAWWVGGKVRAWIDRREKR